ncbi:MAG: endolytic transglycosylase MltG [Desulfovermiculus sp.]
MSVSWKHVLLSILGSGFLASLLISLYVLQLILLPLETPGQKVHVHITPGQSFAQIAASLEEKEVIDNPRIFQMLAVCFKLSANLRAGEYELNTGWSRLEILRALAGGSHILYTLRIPEGLSWRQTARTAAQSGLTTYADFQKTVQNHDLLAEFNIPADTAEGYLFPETYHLPRPEENQAEPIIRLMLQEFQNQIQDIIPPREQPDPQEIHDLVTLASLVEKETGQPGERRTVAGVLVNRLQRGMRLQCDPTVIYGLGRNFDGNLTRKHLQDSSNAYNTYAHAGLPPGPICSPGLDSLRAAQDPEDHEYLYFVSKGDGSHHFSRNLKEHNRAVRLYQLR